MTAKSRPIALSVALVVTLCAPASASNCGLINDSDERHLCNARQKKSASECGLIKDSDKRHYCQAVVKKNASSCGLIQNSDLRHRCRSEAGTP